MIAIWKSPLVLVLASGVIFGPSAPAGNAFPANQAAGDILFDIGSMKPKPDLGFGWSFAEIGHGRNFRWMKHLEADVRFRVREVRDAELWVESMPLFLEYARQVVAVYVNNRFAGEWTFKSMHEFEVSTLKIPGEFLRVGENTLTLRCAHRARVGKDKRELSLCVDRILLHFP